MSEWKGPWKCKKCGTITDESPHFSMWVGRQNQLCDGDLVPYDRRAPNPLLPLVKELREALKQTEWADMDCEQRDCHCPVCGRPDMAEHKPNCSVGIALTRADKALEEEK